jgi:hypothetical protein
MLTSDLNGQIAASNISAVDKLAIRTAIASLELLKLAAVEMGCQVDELTAEMLIQWLQLSRSHTFG